MLASMLEAFSESLARFALPIMFIISVGVFLALSLIGLWSIFCYWGLI